MKRKQHPLVTDLFNTLLACGYEGTMINSVSQDTYKIEVELQLPYHKEIADFEELLPNITQEFHCTDAIITKRLGKHINILFGKRDLSNIDFNPSFLHPNTLQIELPTSYNSHILDFEDGASCHMLNGGAPRMGKTMFLLYMSTVLYLQTNGEIELHITSPKSKDFYPLFELPNVSIAKDEIEFSLLLQSLIGIYKIRNDLLYSPSFKRATDAKTVREFYPNKYYLFKPIFLIIDEYARFSHIQPIQKMVAELVQTAGFVNVHVIIATQRPDARTTLPPDIKMGLMTRICFKTADEANSIVILDEKGAESLPNDKGRAILRDGERYTVQVPKLTYPMCEKLLKPYKKENTNEHINQLPNQETKGCENPALVNKIQALFKESDSGNVFSEQQQSNQRMQQNNETPNNGWFRLTNPTFKR